MEGKKEVSDGSKMQQALINKMGGWIIMQNVLFSSSFFLSFFLSFRSYIKLYVT